MLLRAVIRDDWTEYETPALNGQQLLTTEEREQTLFALIVQCC